MYTQDHNQFLPTMFSFMIKPLCTTLPELMVV
jgi:hypothetical protein